VCDVKTSFVQSARKESVKETFYGTLLPERNPPSVGGGRKAVGLIFGQGTTYAEDDLNAVLSKLAKESPDWMYRYVPCRLNMTDAGPVFETPYPHVLPVSYLAEQYALNERAFRMNYCLEEVGADEKPFTSLHFYLPERWIQRAKELRKWSEQVEAFGYEPPPMPIDELENPQKSRWFRLLAVDPGFSEKRKSSCTGICVGALAPNGDIFILHASKRRRRWDTTVQEIVKVYKQYACDLMVIEAAAQQEAAFYSLEKELKSEHGIARIQRISPGNRSKLERAMFIAPRVNGGHVFFGGRVGSRVGWDLVPDGKSKTLCEDLLAFPVVEETDLVDAFVYCVTALREKAQPRLRQQEAVMTGTPWETEMVQRLAAARARCFGRPEQQKSPALEYRVFGRLN